MQHVLCNFFTYGFSISLALVRLDMPDHFRCIDIQSGHTGKHRSLKDMEISQTQMTGRRSSEKAGISKTSIKTQ